MEERKRTLYLFVYEHVSSIADACEMFYAYDDQDAEAQASEIERSIPHFKRRIDLKHFPRGLMLIRERIPGEE